MNTPNIVGNQVSNIAVNICGSKYSSEYSSKYSSKCSSEYNIPVVHDRLKAFAVDKFNCLPARTPSKTLKRALIEP